MLGLKLNHMNKSVETNRVSWNNENSTNMPPWGKDYKSYIRAEPFYFVLLLLVTAMFVVKVINSFKDKTQYAFVR